MEKELELEMYDYMIEIGYQIKNTKRKYELLREININLKLCLFKFEKYYSLIEIFGNFIEYYNIETSRFLDIIEDEILKENIKKEISKLK